ncbi:MAG: hypothetical protein ACI8XM_002455 [Haloarculaceae archaeon]|jgi:hypothetical protein
MTGATDETDGDATPIVSCDLQGGTLAVYEDRVTIDRSSASMFEDKSIEMAEIHGVEYSGGILTGHIQVRQEGVEPGEPGWFSHPVDENTLYLPRSKRSCAERARDAILERAGQQSPG